MTALYRIRIVCLLAAAALGSAQDLPNTNAELSEPTKRVTKTERQKYTALRDAKRLSEKAEVCEQQGKATEAEHMAQEALALEEQVRGPWHIEVARRLDQVADLYTAHKKEGAAVPLYERARALRQRALRGHPAVYERDGGALRPIESPHSTKAVPTTPQPTVVR